MHLSRIPNRQSLFNWSRWGNFCIKIEQYFSYASINGCMMTAWKMDVWIFFGEGDIRVNEIYERNARVLWAFSNPQKVIGYQNWMHPCSFLSFLFFLWKTLFFLMILPQRGFSIGNPVQAVRRPSDGSRELFVQIYCFSFAGLLHNILTESLVMYHIQIETQLRNGQYLACVHPIRMHADSWESTKVA